MFALARLLNLLYEKLAHVLLPMDESFVPFIASYN